MTHSPAEISRLLATIGRHPRRDLGQNFVADAGTVRRVAALAAVGAGDHVVEIGAGLGSLTLALAETGARVTAVEVDHHLTPVLRDVAAASERVSIVEADAMSLDWAAITDGEPCVLVANLPYNVATPLVCDVLDDVAEVERMVVMVQREVAERFAAKPGSRAYGAVSVKIAYWASATITGDVSREVFVPRPNVESSLVRIVRRPPPCPDVDRGVLFSLVRSAFGQRRKMLRRSLSGIVHDDDLALAGIPGSDRPEQVAVDAWCRLASIVTARRAGARP